MKKRTRKNPNAPDKELASGREYQGKFRYAGDVKRKYKMSVGDAVLAFLLLRRTYQRGGGKCKVSYDTIEAINKGYATNVSRHLKHLKEKGVITEYSYDNRGDGYCCATVSRQFADDTKHSNHYTVINLFDFSLEVMATWTLSERVLFLITKTMWVKGRTYSAASLARFAGMTHQSVIKHLEQWNDDEVVRLKLIPSHPGTNMPYKVIDVAYEDKVRPEHHDEMQEAIDKCLPFYRNSASRMVLDKNGVGVVFRAVTKGTGRIIQSAERIIMMSVDYELKVKKRAYMWLKRNGPMSPRYEELREIFNSCRSQVSNTDILVTAVIPVSDYIPSKAERFVGVVRRTVGTIFSWEGPYDECPALKEGVWVTHAELEREAAANGKKDVDENGYKMYSIDDLF